MNRKNIDNFRFWDFDDLQGMVIVPIEFPKEEGENTLLKKGFRVDGITKQGNSIEGLFFEKQSETNERCYKFIMDNWVNAKK